MKIASVTLTDVRSYSGTASFEFSAGINLLVGANNTGKSTVISALNLLQTQDGRFRIEQPDGWLRVGAKEGNIKVRFKDIDVAWALSATNEYLGSGGDGIGLNITFKQPTSHTVWRNDAHGAMVQNRGGTPEIRVFHGAEPHNLFHLFLSRRKTSGYTEQVNLETHKAISPTMVNLWAKIDRLTGAQNNESRRYEAFMRRVLGWSPSASATPGGKSGGRFHGAEDYFIRLQYMGEGIASVAAMIADLAVAKNKVFLIEEPENDLHPGALSALLEVLAECSPRNQFIISTHSNVVLSRLGAIEGAKTFELRLNPNTEIPQTEVAEIKTAEERFHALEQLGYTCADLGMAEGYLLLEEASAESVILNILIPWFVPVLIGRLETCSSAGVDRMSQVYDSLRRTFLYLKKSPLYKDRSWVRVDGDDAGRKVVEKLRAAYKEARESQFKNLTAANFEAYYPKRYAGKVTAALALSGEAKTEAKKVLLREVLDWAVANRKEAEPEFRESAAEVIIELQGIAEEMRR